MIFGFLKFMCFIGTKHLRVGCLQNTWVSTRQTLQLWTSSTLVHDMYQAQIVLEAQSCAWLACPRIKPSSCKGQRRLDFSGYTGKPQAQPIYSAKQPIVGWSSATDQHHGQLWGESCALPSEKVRSWTLGSSCPWPGRGSWEYTSPTRRVCHCDAHAGAAAAEPATTPASDNGRHQLLWKA